MNCGPALGVVRRKCSPGGFGRMRLRYKEEAFQVVKGEVGLDDKGGVDIHPGGQVRDLEEDIERRRKVSEVQRNQGGQMDLVMLVLPLPKVEVLLLPSRDCMDDPVVRPSPASATLLADSGTIPGNRN